MSCLYSNSACHLRSLVSFLRVRQGVEYFEKTVVVLSLVIIIHSTFPQN